MTIENGVSSPIFGIRSSIAPLRPNRTQKSATIFSSHPTKVGLQSLLLNHFVTHDDSANQFVALSAVTDTHRIKLVAFFFS